MLVGALKGKLGLDKEGGVAGGGHVDGADPRVVADGDEVGRAPAALKVAVQDERAGGRVVSKREGGEKEREKEGKRRKYTDKLQ